MARRVLGAVLGDWAGSAGGWGEEACRAAGGTERLRASGSVRSTVTPRAGLPGGWGVLLSALLCALRRDTA